MAAARGATLRLEPLLSIGDALGNEIALLQVVPQGMNLDNLNHIWSTQTDISYRLSVAYEMALAPVPHAMPVEAAPLVGDPQIVSWGAPTRTPGRGCRCTSGQGPAAAAEGLAVGLREGQRPLHCVGGRIELTAPNSKPRGQNERPDGVGRRRRQRAFRLAETVHVD